MTTRIPRYEEIKSEHIGQTIFKGFGRLWHTRHFIGSITENDVGKRVFLVKGLLEVETEAERIHRGRKGFVVCKKCSARVHGSHAHLEDNKWLCQECFLRLKAKSSS